MPQRVRPNYFVKTALACTLLIGTAFSTPAAEPDETELLDRIQQLEQRVRELEQILLKAVDAPEHKPGKETATPSPTTETPPKDIRVHWKDTLRFDTYDGDIKLRIGGRIQNDWAFFDQSNGLKTAFSDEENGTEFRRARLLIAGTLYENNAFMVQYDFAGGDADFKNMWAARNNLPAVGQLKIGKFKEPIGLDALANSNDATFMEFALPSVFARKHQTGIGLSNTALDQRMTWASGIFRRSDSYGNKSEDGQYDFTSRITGLPWYRDEGRNLLHLGLAYSYQDIDNDLRIKQRPEANLTQNVYLDTGTLDANELNVLDAEAAWVHNSLSLQGEYVHAALDTETMGDASFSGYYGQISYILTGEHRPYLRSGGKFGRVKPKNNFRMGSDGGIGAWELALRYSQLDLNDDLIRGGEEDNITLGVNWYLNPNLRATLNYLRVGVETDAIDEYMNILQTRLQVTF